MSVALAFVPLNAGANFSSKAFREHLTTHWPALADMKRVKSDDGKSVIVYENGTHQLFVALMPTPIPWGDLEGPCQTSMFWPNAEPELRKHKQHFLVTVMGPAESIIEQNLVLTQAIASILTVSPEASGVYWGNATQVISSEAFRELADVIKDDALPFLLWVSYRIGSDKKGSSGFTTGMASLGHMEIEAVNTPEEPKGLYDRLLGLTDYLLTNGPIIVDGNTIGEDEHERIKVVYSKSNFGHEGKVMRLKYGR